MPCPICDQVLLGERTCQVCGRVVCGINCFSGIWDDERDDMLFWCKDCRAGWVAAGRPDTLPRPSFEST